MSDDSSGSAMADRPAGTSSLAPVMAADHVITFFESHRPALLDGDYQISVTQRLQIEADNVQEFQPANPTYFTVAGPRFALRPSDISSVYPPPGASGDFEWTMPHVVLSRPTLPWERTADRSVDDTDAPPWLVLLMFDDNELDGTDPSTVVTVADLREDAEQAVWPFATVESADDPTDPVRVLDLPVEIGAAHLLFLDPRLVSLLTHVRTIGPDNGSKDIESSNVVCAEAIQAGHSYHAYLVSVEGWMAGHTWIDVPSDTTKARFVVLHSWRFTCSDTTSFARELTALGVGRLSSATVEGREILGPSREYLDRGWFPLRHEFRNGDRAISWYRSPLMPCDSAAIPEVAIAPKLPVLAADGNQVRSADGLRLFDATSGMYDVTYAAAWELGRLLSLHHPNIGIRLHQWKRELVKASMRSDVLTAHQGLVVVPHQPKAPALDTEIRNWFVTELVRFGSVPYRYLVPDDTMVPQEQVQFFSVERQWLRCAMDGAFSVGRVSDKTALRDAELIGALDDPPPMDGFILRSRILVDYPGLMIDALAIDGTPAVMARIDHLAPGLLLALYESKLRSVSFHLHPQVVHFAIKPEWQQFVQDGRVDFDQIKAAASIEHAGDLATQMQAINPAAVFTLEMP